VRSKVLLILLLILVNNCINYDPKPNPLNDDAQNTEPDPPDPDPPDPDPPDPDPTDPDPPDPDPTGPDPTEPDPPEPDPPDPDPTEPDPPEPDPPEPDPTEPDPPEPDPTEPDPTEPDPPEPDPTEPDPTEPDPTEPDPTEPDPTEPDPTEPGPTGPDPTEPDPLVREAWHLENTGQRTFSNTGGTSGFDLNIGFSTATGSGVLVAISDDGVERVHEDLAQNFNLELSKNYNLNTTGWFGDPLPGMDDVHGTAVAGIIAAASGNGLGSQGVAPNASIAGLKFIGVPVTSSMQVDQANGNYHIFNYSYGGYSCHFDHTSPALLLQLKFGVDTLRLGKGAIYVKAAGNEFISYISDCDLSIEESSDTPYLGNANLEDTHAYPWTIVTAAINANGISSSYSTPGSSVWISALGGEFGEDNPAILTTDLMGCNRGIARNDNTSNYFESENVLNPNCNYTSMMNGTSAATPMISGVVALLLEVNPALTWRDVKHILAQTAKIVDASSINLSHPYNESNLPNHIYDRGWTVNAANYHFHNKYGFGLVDVTGAINLAKNYNSPLGTFQEVFIESPNNLNQAIPDVSSTGVQNTLSITHNLFIEAVQIKLNVTHTWIGDLGIEITSPSGTISAIMNINSGLTVANINNEFLLSNAFYGESSAGLWKIKIIDGAGEDEGVLNQWSVKVFGH
jgi:hypothetical protein